MTFYIKIRFSSMVTATTVIQGRIQEFWKGDGGGGGGGGGGGAKAFGDPSLVC